MEEQSNIISNCSVMNDVRYLIFVIPFNLLGLPHHKGSKLGFPKHLSDFLI